MKIIDFFKNIKTNKISAMTISGDYIGLNNEYGNYSVGNYIGKTIEVDNGKQILKFCGGILVDVIEKEN